MESGWGRMGPVELQSSRSRPTFDSATGAANGFGRSSKRGVVTLGGCDFNFSLKTFSAPSSGSTSLALVVPVGIEVFFGLLTRSFVGCYSTVQTDIIAGH